MGLKGLLSGLGLNPFGLIALVLSLGTFLAILVWTLTRSRQELERQARLWEEHEDHV